jgi:hypothetical protein
MRIAAIRVTSSSVALSVLVTLSVSVSVGPACPRRPPPSRGGGATHLYGRVASGAPAAVSGWLS